MKIIITESQLDGIRWKYLKYLLGDLKEVHSEKNASSIYWKNNEYGVVIEFQKDGTLWVHDKIWHNFSNFFDLDYFDTMDSMGILLEKHLKIKPVEEYTSYDEFRGETIKLGGISPAPKGEPNIKQDWGNI